MAARGLVLGASLAGAVTAAAAFGYAAWIEPRWLQLRTPRIHMRGLPAAAEGVRIGLLTDLHAVDPRGLRVVRRAAGMLMGERPDLIALTGDFTTVGSSDFDAVLDALGPLDAPLGVYAVPGNHDHRAGIGGWRAAISAHPTIQDLTNRAVIVRLGGIRLCVAGVDDLYEGSPRLLLPPVEEREITLLLAHSPDQAERCRRACDAVDLIVSGHTHGGQIRLPVLGAPYSSADRGDLYEEGLRRRPWTQVYTSRGIGTVRLPMRFLARPEVAVLELTGAPRPPRAR